MTDNYSVQELSKFLDYLRAKGLMKADSVAARKAAVNNILGILTPEESKDVRSLSLDEIVVRFANLKGSGFKPESIRVYKSRVSASIADFIEYRKNPVAFKPNGAGHRVTSSPRRENKEEEKSSKINRGKEVFDRDESDQVVFPIPLRPNLVVRLVGIPGDLSKREASKISAVIMALAQDTDK